MTNPAHVFLSALLSGRADLVRHAKHLDRINVFPVMDGDTGVNMSATLAAIQLDPSAVVDLRLEALPQAISKPLLLGARGNSGLILAEFLVGVVAEISKKGALTFSTFREGVRTGTDRAYGAVSEPKEGTMLTIMRLLREVLDRAEPPFDMTHHAALEAALLDGVRETPKHLDALAAAGVVDAGALGFYLVAAGLTLVPPALFDEASAKTAVEARLTGTAGAPMGDTADRVASAYVAKAQSEGVSERYCVNLAVCAPASSTATEEADFRAVLSPLGTSFNLARFDDVVKIHIHTDTPMVVVAAAAGIGDIAASEIQDMQEALVAAHPETETDITRVPIRVVADSAISLHPDTAAELGIMRIDNLINAAGRMVSDRHIDMTKLLKEMSAGARFTTAQVSAADVSVFLDTVLAHSDTAIFIAVGEAYTGTQELVRRVAEAHGAAERIVILDSRAASGQQGLVCYTVQKFALDNGDLDAVVAYARKQIEACVEYLFIPDLTYLKRSGRIGAIKAAFAGVLSIKPIVGHGRKGAITHATVKSEEGAVHEIFRRIQAHPGDGDLSIMVEYTDNEPFAHTLKKNLEKVFGQATEVILAPLSSSSAVHMGPGTWGVAVTRR